MACSMFFSATSLRALIKQCLQYYAISHMNTLNTGGVYHSHFTFSRSQYSLFIIHISYMQEAILSCQPVTSFSRSRHSRDSSRQTASKLLRVSSS